MTFILFAAFVSTTVSASIGSLGLLLSGEIASFDFGQTWLAWWLGDGMGVLVIAPILLAGRDTARVISKLLPTLKVLEALTLAAALILVSRGIFENPSLAGLGHFPISLSVFPFAIWGALRFGTMGAATVTLIASILAINGTVLGIGPFAVDSTMESQILWCLFADLMAMTGLFLAAVDAEREKALVKLQGLNESLDEQVQKRTDDLTQANRELHGALAERKRLQMEMNEVNEERKKLIGRELHDGLGQQLTGIAFLVSSLHETMDVKSRPEHAIAKQIESQLAEAIASVRSLSRGLDPVALEIGGLSSALYQLAEYARSCPGVQCGVQCQEGLSLADKKLSLNLFRIAQEAICNALRHGKAQKIEIELSIADGKYRLSIEDNGIGFQDQTVKTNATLGLRSMRCRAELIGAKIEIGENPIGGARIVVSGSI